MSFRLEFRKTKNKRKCCLVQPKKLPGQVRDTERERWREHFVRLWTNVISLGISQNEKQTKMLFSSTQETTWAGERHREREVEGTLCKALDECHFAWNFAKRKKAKLMLLFVRAFGFSITKRFDSYNNKNS